jgi:hypothetical protein
MNRRKDLVKLFKAYMNRKENEHSSYNYVGYQSYYSGTLSNTRKVFSGIIYFYEWSDINRVPLKYFSLPLFEKFLFESGLELQCWQREVIYNATTVYITCVPGEKKLIVKGSYDSLKLWLAQNQSSLKLPVIYQGENTRMTPMYKESYY